MIEKPTIIVTSLGRTGTRFFANLFSSVIPDSTSLHEPDILGFFPYRGRKRFEEAARGFRVSGVYNMTFRKLMGQWSLARVSDARVKNDISKKEAAGRVNQQRCEFIGKQKGSIYVESSLGYYGLIEVLPSVLINHRVVYIIRDGRDWVRSKLAWGEMYNKGHLRQALRDHAWPTANQLEDDPYFGHWTNLSRFERLCWAWDRLNRYALNSISMNPNAKLFRFEDLFTHESRREAVEELVRFCGGVSSNVDLRTNGIEMLLQKKVHASNGNYPPWDEWTSLQRKQFESICGSLMIELDYELF